MIPLPKLSMEIGIYLHTLEFKKNYALNNQSFLQMSNKKIFSRFIIIGLLSLMISNNKKINPKLLDTHRTPLRQRANMV